MTKYLLLRLAAIPVLMLTAWGQNTGDSTGAAAGTAAFQLQSFDIETTRTINNVFPAATVNIPPAVLSSLQAGALEVRERLIFNPQMNTLTSTLFTVAPNSPTPSPLSAIGGSGTLGSWTMNVDRVYQTNTPLPAMMLVGTISSAAGGVIGRLVGAPAAVSIGYTSGANMQINDVVVLVAGVGALYSPAAKGSVSVPPPPSQGAAGGSQIQITLAPRELVTSSKQMTISAAVNDPAGASAQPLTYHWRLLNGMAAAMDHADSANLEVTFNQGKGDYPFELTVTNALGQTATARVTITYYGM